MFISSKKSFFEQKVAKLHKQKQAWQPNVQTFLEIDFGFICHQRIN
jgi:hypothetical protein